MGKLTALLVWIVACGISTAWAAEAVPQGLPPGVPYARDLAADGDLATARNAAVLIAFVGTDCPYCETLLREFLVPMSRNQDYHGKVVMRRIELGSQRALRDFSGKATEHGDFAASQGIRFVPTIMLFDARGRRLASPLVGLRTVDYFGADIDEAIDQALARLRSGKHGVKTP